MLIEDFIDIYILYFFNEKKLDIFYNNIIIFDY